MANIYLIFIIVLVVLAASDLIVGVSNDAVNFLNSSLGSKVASGRVILIIAGLGVLVGATMSGGMMEVARKGIFRPELFQFKEIMLIFMAVMVTDVILLNTFNSFGMPTSTTVSVVFELLGASVSMALIKVIYENGETGLQVGDYINSSKALLIIGGILLSVVVAFTVGTIVQFITRLIFSFDYEKKMKYYGGIWGSFALTSILYFILIKGAKNIAELSIYTNYAKEHPAKVLLVSFVVLSIVLQLINRFTKINIFKIIVLIGTFALAMAFAGNDLVNFIGVPIAGYQSYELFVSKGGATDFLMTEMAGKQNTPILFLTLAGLIMVLTLWLSKKARRVIKTSLDLSRQDDGAERFGSTLMGRTIVRASAKTGESIKTILPAKFLKKIEQSFDQRPFNEKVNALKKEDVPSFDLVRAAVTLVVASILISLGTSLHLPLSTTYVTFMVAMGTSLADGAWGRESAVFRVSGVLSVIGGWFFTALSAFTAAFVVILLFHYFGPYFLFVLLFLILFLLYKSHQIEKRKENEEQDPFAIGHETPINSNYIYNKGVNYTNRLFHSVMTTLTKSNKGLAKDDIKKLQESKKEFKQVFEKIKRVNNKISYTIERLNDNEEDAGLKYIESMYFLHEIALSNNRIVRPIYEYVANSHKPLIPAQNEELKSAVNMVKDCYQNALEIINNNEYNKTNDLIKKIERKLHELDAIRKNQVKRIKNKDVGTRNSVLFFDTISEIRHLLVYLEKFIKAFKGLNEITTE